MGGDAAEVDDSEAPTAVPGQDLTTPGTALGTLAYMSPEQARGKGVDVRTDLFSLGGVLYEMATGRRAFEGTTPARVSEAILNRDPAPVSRLAPSLPPRLGEILGRALEKDRRRRYQTARELQADLEALRRGLHSGVSGGGRAVGSKAMVAVLPLTSLGVGADHEYFSDGMTEDIIAQLSRIESLGVISRTSVMRYKGSSEGLKSIASALEATHVVEGSVRRAGNRLRIVAQLIDASTDSHLWAETFDRAVTDVFAVQSEVAQRIAGALQARLTPEEKRRVERRPTDDLEAYDLYLRGRHHANLGTAKGLATAIGLYEQALGRDPGFAGAWAALAGVHHFHLAGYYHLRPREAAARIVECASRALELDPESAEAHTMRGLVETHYNLDFDAGARHLERALELGPNVASVRLARGNHLVATGRVSEALEEARVALQLDPAAEVVHIHAAFLLYLARRFDDALLTLELAAAQFGRKVIPLTQAETLIAVGRAPEAVEILRELCARMPIPWNQGHLAWALAAAGEDAACREVLVALHAREASEHVWPLAFALAYSHLGDLDRAFEYLERCYEERVAWLWAAYAPTFDVFRQDPRFEDIARRLGTIPPPGWSQAGATGPSPD